MGGPAWTEAEKTIVRTAYPLLGAAGTRDALQAAGFDRTLVAIKYRAHILGSLHGRGQWTPKELAILHRYYPHTGPNGVKAALAAKGYYRTAFAIISRASIERVKVQPPPPPPPPKPRRKRARKIAGVRLTDPQRQLLRVMPYDALLDVENNPLHLPANSCRQIARSLQKKRLVKHEGLGLYRLTLAGLPAWRAVGGDRAA